MDFEYDREKDAINQAKHGVSLAPGAVMLENRIGEIVDDRRNYGEIRINAFGLVATRLFVCTYTMRGETHRLGDRVTVRLVEASPVAGALRFELLSAGRNEGRRQRRSAGGRRAASGRRKALGKKRPQ